MIYYKLAGTRFEVSAIAMGSALFGAAYTRDFAFGQLDIFAEMGGNFIDTAHVYNDWIPGEKCRSEKVIGGWLKKNDMRGKIVLVTKGAHPPMDEMTRNRVSRAEIRKDLNESLQYLQTDHIDIYLLHRDDIAVPVGEIVEWMNELIAEGLIKHWGCSNWTTKRIMQANAYANAHGLEGMRLNQAMWSFATINRDKLPDKTIVPLDEDGYLYHAASGMNLMAFTSQAKGYFPRAAAGENLPDDVTRVYDNRVNDEKLEFIKEATARTGLAASELSLLYFARQPFVAVPVVSYDTDKLLKAGLSCWNESNLEALDGVIFPHSL